MMVNMRIFEETWILFLKKLDRSKIYGSKKVVPKSNGELCQKLYIDDFGTIKLVNGCSKFFANPDVEQKEKTSSKKEKKQDGFSDLYFSGTYGYFSKDITISEDYFLEKRVVETYKLESNDSEQEKNLKSMIGDKIYEFCTWTSEGSAFEWFLFANEKGIFVSHAINIYADYVSEDVKIEPENESEEENEFNEIDFEDLW